VVALPESAVPTAVIVKEKVSVSCVCVGVPVGTEFLVIILASLDGKTWYRVTMDLASWASRVDGID